MFIINILNVIHTRSGKIEIGINVEDDELYFKDHEKCREIEKTITENVMNRMKAEKLCDHPINNITTARLNSFISGVIQSLQISSRYGKMNVRTQQMLRPT